MNKKTRFLDAIGALVPGNRDGNLVRVATYGIAAGLSPAEVADAIMQGSPGETRPDPAAVRRAVENCYGATKPFAPAVVKDYPFTRWVRKTEEERLEELRRSLPDELRQSVHDMIEASKGATPDDLILKSPTPIPLAPREQAAAHIRALGADFRWKVWAGTIGKGGKRGIVIDPATLAAAIQYNLCPRVPTHISLNPLTGGEGLTKDGKPSYDCEATVAALRFCLVEFDALPLPSQVALWTTVTRTLRDEVPVVSIVYSGGKSLHAVVLVPPSDLASDEITAADKSAYAQAWDKLMRRFASSPVPAERMDLAPSKNAAVHTRVAGAKREETGKFQKLLYLDTALAKGKLEIF